jgi:ribonuclease BN (tRNA processing enzyme)
MKVQFLGTHNCESQETRLVSLLVDDVLALEASGLTSSLSFAAQLKLKGVLLTHHHYDHIKDIPMLGMNLSLSGVSIGVYSITPVYDALTAHLLNDELYPNYFKRPRSNPVFKFITVEPLKTFQIENYSVLAVPVSHSVLSVGYQITTADGKTMFYTGDTGPGLSDCWKWISPQLIIIEVTASNKLDDLCRRSGHLTPNLLKPELIAFRALKGYLPRVAAVHISPHLEAEITTELTAVAEELHATITVAHEGMELRL